MAWLDFLARKFAEALVDPKFETENAGPYRNQYGRLGMRYSGRLNDRTFYISVSDVRGVRDFLPKKVARIIKDGTNLDRRKSLIYLNRNFEPGLRVEAWYCGRWLEVWTPITVGGQPADDLFAKFALEHGENEL